MTEIHSKHLVRVKFHHQILTLFFLGGLTTFLGRVGEIESKNLFKVIWSIPRPRMHHHSVRRCDGLKSIYFVLRLGLI